MELATELLIKAVKYDNDNRKVEALSLYTDGINKLIDVAKGKDVILFTIHQPKCKQSLALLCFRGSRRSKETALPQEDRRVPESGRGIKATTGCRSCQEEGGEANSYWGEFVRKQLRASVWEILGRWRAGDHYRGALPREGASAV